MANTAVELESGKVRLSALLPTIDLPDLPLSPQRSAALRAASSAVGGSLVGSFGSAWAARTASVKKLAADAAI